MSMTRLFSGILIVVSSILAVAGDAAATTHSNHAVARIEPPDPVRDCLFFTLDGVTTSEPAVAQNNPWFAVPRSHPGFREIYAAVLLARATGALLTVITTGQAESTCAGHPGANTVVIEP